jgi:hypothetical protein
MATMQGTTLPSSSSAPATVRGHWGLRYRGRTCEGEALGLAIWPVEFFQGLVFKAYADGSLGSASKMSLTEFWRSYTRNASDLTAMTFAAVF